MHVPECILIKCQNLVYKEIPDGCDYWEIKNHCVL